MCSKKWLDKNCCRYLAILQTSFNGQKVKVDFEHWFHYIPLPHLRQSPCTCGHCSRVAVTRHLMICLILISQNQERSPPIIDKFPARNESVGRRSVFTITPTRTICLDLQALNDLTTHDWPHDYIHLNNFRDCIKGNVIYSIKRQLKVIQNSANVENTHFSPNLTAFISYYFHITTRCVCAIRMSLGATKSKMAVISIKVTKKVHRSLLFMSQVECAYQICYGSG